MLRLIDNPQTPASHEAGVFLLSETDTDKGWQGGPDAPASGLRSNKKPLAYDLRFTTTPSHRPSRPDIRFGHRPLDLPASGPRPAAPPPRRGGVWATRLDLGSPNLAHRSSINPSNRDTHKFLPFIPPRRTPLPFHSRFHQSCPDRILVHVVELLFQLLPAVHVKRIVPRLPDRVRFNEPPVRRKTGLEQALQRRRRTLLPLLHEKAELTRLGKPDQRVHMVRHDHEANTASRLLRQLRIQHPQHDLLCPVMLEKFSPLSARERDEVHVQFRVVNPQFSHNE